MAAVGPARSMRPLICMQRWYTPGRSCKDDSPHEPVSEVESLEGFGVTVRSTACVRVRPRQPPTRAIPASSSNFSFSRGDNGTQSGCVGQVQQVSGALLGPPAIPAVAPQRDLIDEVADDEWWVDVSLPMLELARRKLRGLVQFIGRAQRNIVYTDFEDTIGDQTPVELPWVAAGAPQDIKRAEEQARGLGLFIRSLVGLDRQAAAQAFNRYLVDTVYTAAQIDFVNLIVNELTANGVMEPSRLYESPFTDRAPQGPDFVFPDEDVDVFIDTLKKIRAHALPEAAAPGTANA